MRSLLSLIVTSIVGSTLGAADPPVWPTPTNEQKPWTRWWWLGSAVTPAEITRSLEEFKAAGLGGVEICPIYGAKGAEEKYIDFLSPKWMAMLAHTTSEAKRLGLGVDLTTGTGWPFGGPGVTAADASAKVAVQKYDVETGKGLNQALPVGTLRALVAYPAEGKPIDLTAKVKDDKLDWVAPEGTWKLYAAVQQSPVMKVKRAAPGGVGNVLDPFSTAKLDRYLAGFDKAFAGYTAPMPRAFFHDSYEYYNANWTDDLFAEFQKRRGYDLKDHLPELMGDGPADTCARVKCDYRETISDLHREYVERWTAWCHKHVTLSRNQAHGGPGNILDAYAAADIPECEIYTRYEPRHRPFLKMASSAAHLTGRNLASAESFTWLREHFQTPLSAIKPAADFLFLSGVNHLVYHGTPFSPADAPWPGWQFYASVNFGPQGGLWRDLPAFNAYVARVQSVLQAGKPANDVLLYVPFHDFWQTNDNAMLKMFAMPGTWMESHPVHAVAMELERVGVGYDEVSDRLLVGAKVEGKDVMLGGNRYRAIVVPSCKTIHQTTAKKLLALAGDGAAVLFVGSPPGDLAGFAATERERNEYQASWQGLGILKTTKIKGGSGGVKIGKGIVSKTVFLDDGLQSLRSKERLDTDPIAATNLRYVKRLMDDGTAYFVVNDSPRLVETSVLFGGGARSVSQCDPMVPDQVTWSVPWDRRYPRIIVPVRLFPGESRVIRTFTSPPPENGKPSKSLTPAGEVVSVHGSWNVQFIEGGPVLPKSYETTDLKFWTTRDDPELKRFAGTAKYSIMFEKPAVAGATDWTLDLGKVCESARVSLNGKPVATLFANPFRVPVTDYLRDGKNTLEIEVTNLAANRIADMDRRKVNWKYFNDANVASHPDSRRRGVLDASNWPLFDSGLLGPVTLIPEKEFDPGKK
jgi:hypothetical protein